MSARRTHALAFLVTTAVIALSACASTGPYVWVDKLQGTAESPTNGYVFGEGDLISIQVWDHPELATRARVRDDGRISVPFLGDVKVAAMAPDALARELETDLKARGLVVAPHATVSLEERGPLKVAVLGEVARPGLYPLDRGAGVAEALASAGGLTEFAHRDRIFVMRRSPQLVRIRFTFDALVGGRGAAATFQLRPGDVVVSE